MSKVDGITEFADKKVISELIHRYGRSMDQLDIPLGHSIWHDDAYADYGADVYQGDGQGAIDCICEMNRGLLCHSHQVSNIEIEIVGNQAKSETLFAVAMWMKNDESLTKITLWERCCDRWSKRNGRWAIDQRVTAIDFDEFREFLLTAADRLYVEQQLPQAVYLWQ